MIALTAAARDRLAAVADALMQTWRTGSPPDALRALRENPDLLRERSLVIDLAYEEYCAREEAGEAPDLEPFCSRFPAFQSHIREMIRDHRFLADQADTLVPPSAWPAPGGPFEGLVVVRELGRGGFARAYLARDPATGDRPVVLKLSAAPSGEAKTLGAISHPNVVGVYWSQTVGGMYAVCMPFAGTATLRDVVDAAFGPTVPPRSARTLLAAAALPADILPPPGTATPLLTGRESYPDAVAVVAGRLADAVAYLHRNGISHGDLKPSNVLLGPGGHPYLIDFNLAARGADSLLRWGGTLPYMAPERLRQMLGRGPAAGPAAAADVYAFGAVLYELLTGRVPAEPDDRLAPAESAADLLRRALALRGPAAGRPEIPRPLARLIDRCLDPDPGRRPAIESVRRKLDGYVSRRARRGAVLLATGLVCMGLAVGTVGPDRGSAGGGAASPPGGAAEPAPPATPEEFFARGLRHLKAENTSPAMTDFDRANKLKPDGPNSAYLAYCLTVTKYHRTAVDRYREAIEQFGCSTAWIHNNLAYCLLCTGTASDHFREAVAEATKALRLAPDLRAARLNRAYAQYRLRLLVTDATQPDPSPADDIAVALHQGPYTAKLYHRAAVVTLKFGGDSEECRRRAVHYMAEAVGLGHPPRSLATDRAVTPYLAGRADFQRVVELPPQPPPASASAIDPYLAHPPLD